MVARPANALWRRTVRGELTAAKAAVRMTVLAKAPVASVPLEQDLRGDDAPRAPAQSPSLRLSLPGPREALGGLRRYRGHPLRPSGGRPWDACQAHLSLATADPRHASTYVGHASKQPLNTLRGSDARPARHGRAEPVASLDARPEGADGRAFPRARLN